MAKAETYGALTLWLVLAGAQGGGCTFADLDLSKKGCPCATGWECVEDRCVRTSELGGNGPQGDGDLDPDSGSDSGEPSGDGGDGTSSDAGGDGDQGDDGGLPAITSESCEATSTQCDNATPWCAVFYSQQQSKWVSECVAQEVTAGLNEACAAGEGWTCGDGLGCSWVVGLGYNVCTPFCTAHEDCPAETPYCTYPVGDFGIGMCTSCIVTEDSWLWPDCEAGSACLAKGGDVAPVCGTPGIKQEGESCTSSADCAKATMCVCSGGAKVGDECTDESDGVCRAACWPWSVGKADDCTARAADTTCTGVASAMSGSQYSIAYCKPN